MYLKSIEVQGFKSFANKIVFRFDNGITAIVGPNGSGKSNVADAVRWVLGEQSAKQLRGGSMQDVIFAGTEMRKPLGFASVSITLDNSDHQLPVSYDEVTVTRRVYRSGESEYLLNGVQVRLKDINEIFYDTGIGKEGYSIIGQGQIDKILSGKPEDRRELFDEAVGIVKFKRRKTTARKKLEAERQNLARVEDILTELTRQLGPLERQAESAKIYLQKREELKRCDIRLFLLDFDRIREELEEIGGKQQIAQAQLLEVQAEYDGAREEYESQEAQIERLEADIQKKSAQISEGQLRRQQFENQIELLHEQINTARTSDEHLQSRIASLGRQIEDYDRQEKEALGELKALREKLEIVKADEAAASETVEKLKNEVRALEQKVEKGKSDIIGLLNQRASIKARIQRQDTLLEQNQVRKASLAGEALQLKSENARQETARQEVLTEYEAIGRHISELNEKSELAGEQLTAAQQELRDLNQRTEQEQTEYHRESSRLESLRNIAERYDGYGSSIRKVMERKKQEPGLIGVVADIIQVEKKYEVAIETALGSSIQNIVTEDEETAKRQIEFLKKNKLGRATFLPLSGIRDRGAFSKSQELKEPEVVALASDLVKTDPQYSALARYLLGKTVVVDQIDHAIALARKYRHSLRIVTLDGELFSPGGSMSGGAFKNSSNLLGRRREIEELEKQVAQRAALLEKLQDEIETCRDRRSALREEIVGLKEELQQQYLSQNTAKLRLDELDEKQGSSFGEFERVRQEITEIEELIREIGEGRRQEQESLSASEKTEKDTEQEIASAQAQLAQLRGREEAASARMEEVRLNSSRLDQNEQFIRQNISRIRQEKERLKEERRQFENEVQEAAGSIEEKNDQIRRIRKTLEGADGAEENLKQEMSVLAREKEEKNELHKQFFKMREEISERMNLLDRETFRLNAQIEKLNEQKDRQVNYMWEEYALTVGAARELREEGVFSAASLKKSISALKNEIRELGNVNVNAIEDYKELSERHRFLSAQHDDLQKAEDALVKIIEELDAGMRAQFKERFARIRKEFDTAFKQLFGGGKGTLELVEDEDVLEAGIRIIAQPPGKKLQNMMQLSGGEKSLTAIALLFAIQNMKPSPFCLLDEIEAALDENNVERYAEYLHKLTKNTQFIIITHRRGTMNAADRMYGITMQEKGVSALVSVNMIDEDLDA